jgi:hypothetical protein
MTGPGDLFAEKIARRVDENAGAVAGFAVSIDCAAVPNSFERSERKRHYIATWLTIDCGHEAYAACVAFFGGAIQAILFEVGALFDIAAHFMDRRRLAGMRLS